MSAPTFVSPADQGRQVLLEALSAGGVVVISGAGLSTGSGIPAYRDREGQWQHPPPVRHQEFLASSAVRQRYWARSLIGWPRIADAAPNRGHRALAQLESSGAVVSVITQNVDGLHQRAGSEAVIELHGGLAWVICLDCQARYSRAVVQDWMTMANPRIAERITVHNSLPIAPSPAPSTVAQAVAPTAPDGDAEWQSAQIAEFHVPTCHACQGTLKPDVVFFGDSVPRQRVAQAAASVEQASSLLVVGSSLMVYSGFRFVEQAHRLGKSVFAINQGVTRADALLSAKLDADCAATLVGLAELLCAEK
jgi:NAD-dependent SIR2 family protein deacetylase